MGLVRKGTNIKVLIRRPKNPYNESLSTSFRQRMCIEKNDPGHGRGRETASEEIDDEDTRSDEEGVPRGVERKAVMGLEVGSDLGRRIGDFVVRVRV